MPVEKTIVQTNQEVSALLSVPHSHIAAGGTALPQNEPELFLVDISSLEGLDGIRQKSSRIEIGPLASLQSLADSPLIRAQAPVLAAAAAEAGDAEIRKRGTLGGNLAGSPAGDTAAALLACGAKLTIRTESDFREILIDRFWDQNGENDLQYDEWIVRVTLQLPKEKYRGAAYAKSGIWDSTRMPAAAAAVQLAINDKNIITAIRGGIRPGFGAVRRMFALEKALKNNPATDENFEKAARSMIPAVRDTMQEPESIAFFTELLRTCRGMAEERRSL